jgi:hypothetical protein
VAMNVLEKEIEDMIWQGLIEDRPLLRKKGLWVWDKASYYRQVDFGSYGICDIIGIQVNPKEMGSRYMSAHIMEIKKEEINSATLFQAIRYAKAVKRIIEIKLKNTTCECGITLIGKTIDKKSEFVYLPDVINNIALYTYKLDFKQGILFQRECDYHVTNESFPDYSEFNYAFINMVAAQIKRKEAEDLPF